MSEEEIKETATAYTVSTTKLVIPPTWTWLTALTPEEQTAFFQEVLDAIAEAQQSNDWTRLKEQISA